MTDEEKKFTADMIDQELERVGYITFKVTDGDMFVFNAATIEKLAKAVRSNPDGRAAILVKRSVTT